MDVPTGVLDGDNRGLNLPSALDLRGCQPRGCAERGHGPQPTGSMPAGSSQMDLDARVVIAATSAISPRPSTLIVVPQREQVDGIVKALVG